MKEEEQMSKKDHLIETFIPIDPSTKNYKPDDDNSPEVDPTKPPSFPIGDSAGEKPKGDKSD
jgi:hypothetical protein